MAVTGDPKSLTIGPYRCQRRLGSGACGTVYAAVHAETGLPWAIKRLSDDLLADPDAADGVLQALVAARRLIHPNIVSIVELLEHQGVIFGVSELVAGANLSKILQHSKTLPLDAAMCIGLQICAALDHAHTMPHLVVHGALWPTNVLISVTGEVKISDFGASAAGTHPRGGDVSVRTRCGYLSPEQLEGEAPSQYTDIYGVGVLLYQMVAGRPPFLGETAMQTIELVTQSTASFEGLPWRLADALRRALARDPRARHASASALADDLRRVAPQASTPEAKAAVAALVPVAQVDTVAPLERTTAPAALASLPGAPPEDDPTSVETVAPTDELASGEPSESDAASPFVVGRGSDDEPTSVDPVLPTAELDLVPTQVTGPLRLGQQGPDRTTSDVADDPTLPAPNEALSELLTDPRHSSTDEALPAVEQPTDPSIPTDTRSNTAVGAPNGAMGPTGPLPQDVLERLRAATPRSNAPSGHRLREPLATLGSPDAPSRLPPTPTAQPLAAPPPIERRQQPEISEEPSVVPTGNWMGTDGELSEEFSAPAELREDLPEEMGGTPEPLGPPPSRAAASGESFSSSYSSVSDGSVSDFSRSLSGSSLSGVTFDPEPGAPLYDGESGSRSLEPPPARSRRPKKTRRLTSAHALLIVAILAFAFAVGLLIRRLLRAPHEAPVVDFVIDAALAVPVPLDARTPDLPPRDAAPPADDAPTADSAPPADAALPPDAPPPADAAPAPVSTSTRKLVVRSRPVGNVYVEGQHLGESPVAITIPYDAKRLTVVIAAPLHAIYRREISITKARAQRLDVQLERASYARSGSRKRGVLRVDCVEGDFRRILVNGKDSGRSCPTATFFLWPGRYRISFYDFLREDTRRVNVTVFPRRTRHLRLTRKPR